MQLKDAIKDANKSYRKLLKHDHWELRESLSFYWQSVKDFCYATKNLFVFILNISALIIASLLYPIAVLIRVFKK